MKNYFIIVKAIFVVLFLCLFVIGCTEQEPDVDMFNDHYLFLEYGTLTKFNVTSIGEDGDYGLLQQYQFDEDTQTLKIDTIPYYNLQSFISFMRREKDRQYYIFGRYLFDPYDNKRLSFIRGYPISVRIVFIKMVSCDARGKAEIEIYNNGDKYKEITLKPGEQYGYTADYGDGNGAVCVIKSRFIKKENVILY